MSDSSNVYTNKRRTCFRHPAKDASAPPFPSFKQLKIDLIDFNNLSPSLAASLERIPGKNFQVVNTWIARGCGHPIPVNCPSGICACCIIKNSLTSGHEARSLLTLEAFAYKYCKQYFPDLLKKSNKLVANVRQWQDCLNGYTDPLPTKFVSVHGLEDTVRERITACEITLQTLLIHASHDALLCSKKTKSPKQVS